MYGGVYEGTHGVSTPSVLQTVSMDQLPIAPRRQDPFGTSNCKSRWRAAMPPRRLSCLGGGRVREPARSASK
jgi:hypothetical protein